MYRVYNQTPKVHKTQLHFGEKYALFFKGKANVSFPSIIFEGAVWGC